MGPKAGFHYVKQQNKQHGGDKQQNKHKGQKDSKQEHKQQDKPKAEGQQQQVQQQEGEQAQQHTLEKQGQEQQQGQQQDAGELKAAAAGDQQNQQQKQGGQQHGKPKAKQQHKAAPQEMDAEARLQTRLASYGKLTTKKVRAAAEALHVSTCTVCCC